MDRVARDIRNAVQLGERLLCDLREFETTGRSEWTEDIVEILCSDGKKEVIHRFIFRSASPTFAIILSESELSEPISLDISSDILRIIIDFIYSTQKLRFSTSQVVELFAAASRFKIDGLAFSIREAVDAGFFESFLDDQDSLLRVSDRDIAHITELFDGIEIEPDQGNSLRQKIRLWAGTDRDRLSKFMEVFDALSRLDLEEECIAEPSRMRRRTGIPLWRRFAENSKTKLCSLRIRKNGELSLHETGESLPLSLADDCDIVMSGDVLIRCFRNALRALRLDPRSPDGYTELSRLDGHFTGLRSTPDGRMFAWWHQTIHWISQVNGVLTKTRVGEASKSIVSVHFIEGSPDRAPRFAIVVDPGDYRRIEFMDCNTGVIKSSFRILGDVIAVSSDKVIVMIRQFVHLIFDHDFDDIHYRRSLREYRAIYHAEFIGRSELLLFGWTSPKYGRAFVTLFNASDGSREGSEIQIDFGEFRIARILPNRSKI